MAEYVDYSNGRQNYRQHSYTGDGSWERTTHETDAYEDSILEQSRRQFERSIQMEKEKENAYFEQMRRENQQHNPYEFPPPGLPPPPQNVPTRKDEMQSHLRIVREKLRLRRLQHEKNQIVSNETRYNNIISTVNRELERQSDAVHNVVNNVQANESDTGVAEHSPGGGLEAVFPPKLMSTVREEVRSRRPDLWEDHPSAENRDQNHENNFTVNRVHPSECKRYQPSTIDDFGGGLGDILIRREPRRRPSETLPSPVSQGRRPRGRPRVSAADFGGDLGQILRPHRSQQQFQPRQQQQPHSNVQNRTASSLQRERQQAAMSNWGGGGLGEVLVSRPSESLAPVEAPAPPLNPRSTSRAATNRLNNDFGGQSLGDIMSQPNRRRRNTANEQTSSNARPVEEDISNAYNAVQETNRRLRAQIRTVDSTGSTTVEDVWGGQSLDQIVPSRGGYSQQQQQRQRQDAQVSAGASVRRSGSSNSRSNSRQAAASTGSSDFMTDSEMTYERLLALDDNVASRQLAVAAKKGKNKTELFKMLRNGFYRTKKDGGEEDECAICLSPFEHHECIKKFPCSHVFHVDCAKELLNYDTRCALCRYDLVKKGY
jgi:hypothetical protein